MPDGEIPQYIATDQGGPRYLVSEAGAPRYLPKPDDSSGVRFPLGTAHPDVATNSHGAFRWSDDNWLLSGGWRP